MNIFITFIECFAEPIKCLMLQTNIVRWCADSTTLITMRAFKPAMTFASQITGDCFMLQRTVWCADPSRLTIDHCPRDSLLLLAGPMTPSFLSFAPSSSCRCWFLCVLMLMFIICPTISPPFTAECGSIDIFLPFHLPP